VGEQQQPPRLNPLYRGAYQPALRRHGRPPAAKADMRYGRGIVRHHMSERVVIIEKFMHTNIQPHIQPHISHSLTRFNPSQMR
jgi:hypothetical protein